MRWKEIAEDATDPISDATAERETIPGSIVAEIERGVDDVRHGRTSPGKSLLKWIDDRLTRHRAAQEKIDGANHEDC